MHMSDALITPAVGAAMWAVSATTIAYSIKKIKEAKDDKIAPLMGVMGAFIFAAQMINFSIPGTGSSGHLGGGLILAALLGPWAGFLTMVSVLSIQALFFADGGLLALGCNIFNLGFLSCFVAYPLIYRLIARGNLAVISQGRLFIAAFVGAIVALQLGAFSVVLETRASGISELPFKQFLLLMQPIHLAIGAVEGLATAAVILFVRRMQPALLETPLIKEKEQSIRIKPLVLALTGITVLIGGVLSWFASSHPDGLEWATARVAQTEELALPDTAIHKSLSGLQEKTAFLPDYDFKAPVEATSEPVSTGEESGSWPQVNTGTSVSGLVGGVILFLIALILGFGSGKRKRLSHS